MPRKGKAAAERKERERVARRRRGPIEVPQSSARRKRYGQRDWMASVTARGLEAVESEQKTPAGVGLKNRKAASPARLKNFPPRPVRPQIDRAGGNDTE